MFYCFVLFLYAGGEECNMQDGSKGTCVPIKQCNWYLQKHASGPFDHSELEICSYDVFHAIICCGPDEDDP